MKRSDKFQNLEKIAIYKIRTPRGIYIDNPNNCRLKVEDFLEKSRSRFFIVRSAVPIEDGFSRSYAGCFYSSKPIKKEAVLAQIRTSFEKNFEIARELGIETEIHLMLQEFIESARGGVIAYPWKYFFRHFLVQVSSNPQFAVRGKKSKIGILSLDEKFPDLLGFENEEFLELRRIVDKLSGIFYYPIDIEFAINSEGEVFILQVRPLTSGILGFKPIEKSMKGEGEVEKRHILENFPFLSPKSYEKIKEAYNFSEKKLRDIGISGRLALIKREVTGQIFDLNPESNLEIRGIFNSIKFGFARTGFELELRNKKAKNFNEAFFNLILAGLYGKDNVQDYPMSAYDYELMFDNLEIESFNIKKAPLRSLAKFRLLEVLKKERVFSKHERFLLFGDRINDGRKEYERELEFSVYDYSRQDNENLNRTLISGRGNYIGNILFEEDVFRGEIRREGILVCKYVRPELISKLHLFTGILAIEGAPLSHSAIRARELGILFISGISKKIIEELKSFERVEIDTKKMEIKRELGEIIRF